MQTKDEAQKKIETLVRRFDEQIETYKKDYNETQTRRDFIDPFWKALGWDIDNENGYTESYREVIHEDRIKVDGATKAPDYSFRLPGGKRLFFLEAKKPGISIKGDPQPAYQIRRYGWSAKMAISIISDFEEFAVYDCINKPKQADSASVSRIKYLTYTDYIKEFDFIWDTFSKECVLKGSFDKYIQSDKNKKGTTTVDSDFLASLDKWRVELAKNIALRNKDISEDELNYAVQLTIDRIVFIRIAEDRNVEQYGHLQEAVKNGDYYQNLLQRFRVAEQKYNSGLFDFKKDKISAQISIDNKVIKNIISGFYYPACPYEFSVLSVEILGSAYERFLGKQISLSKSGRAVIEEKPEVRKAGGVYYTPQYIVDYIVKNTVGKLIEKKTPKEISGIKIVDPACGSGSFLIGAYQYLLNWHKDYYTQNGASTSLSPRNKDNPLTPAGELITAEKKRILINNIYGVDLDGNAVEVTKLSLLLKCMEGETKESIEAQQQLFHDRILPTLDNNIKNGNSLIDLDYYDNQLDFGEERKIKPFSWQKSFPEIFKQGGFDCVIGNPPYDVLEKDRLGGAIPHLALKYYIQLNNSYIHALGGKLNLYRFFVVKTIQLTKDKGRFGLIIPSSILGDKSCHNTREFLLSSASGLEFDCFPQKDNPAKRIFEDAKLSTTIFFGKKTDSIKEAEQKFIIRTYPANSFNDEHKKCFIRLEELKAIDSDNIPIPLIDNSHWQILKRIHATEGIENLGKLSTDIVIRRGEINQTIYKDFIEEEPKGNERLIKGVQIGPYRFNKKLSQGKVECFNEKKFLQKNSLRTVVGFERIATQRITGVDERLRIVATIVDPKTYFADSTNSIHLMPESKYNLKYILGLLNSNLFQWRFKLTSTNNNVGTNELEAMPFKVIDFENKIEVQQQEQIIKHVDQLLQLNQELQTVTLPNQIEQIQSRIAYSEDKINALVYELYELTPEEIEIVEMK